MSAFIEVRLSPDQTFFLDLDQVSLIKASRGKESQLIVEISFPGIDPPIVLERKFAEDFLPIFRNHVRVRYNLPHRAATGPQP